MGIKSEVNKEFTLDQMKLVLFRSMLKMQELATINAPFDTGLLASRINLTPQIEGFTEYTLSADTEYADAVEFGTSPHVIKPNQMKALKFKIDGKTIFSKKVMHPGTEAQPYMRPALDQVKLVWVPRFFERVLAKKGNNL